MGALSPRLSILKTRAKARRYGRDRWARRRVDGNSDSA